MVSVEILKKFKPEPKWDIYQMMLKQPIEIYCCAWTFLLLVLVGKKWRNNIIYLFLVHWALLSTGYAIDKIKYLYPKQYKGEYDYESNDAYFYGHFISRIFVYFGNIVGDWYLLFRTKALVKSNKKLVWVYITLIIYNITRLLKDYFNYTYRPFPENFDPDKDELTYHLAKIEYKKNIWISDLLLHTACVIYDFSVIMALKRNVFVKYENVTTGKTKGNFFLVKFQRLSVYRLYFTTGFTICCFPLILLFCVQLFISYHNIDKIEDLKGKVDYFKKNCDDKSIENVRICIVNLYFILMYIDQILLRHYAKENQVTVMPYSSNASYSNNRSFINNNSVNNNSSINVNNNTGKFSFSKVYHDHINTNEDIEGQNLINYNYKSNDYNYNKSLNKSVNNNEKGMNYRNIDNNYENKIKYYDVMNKSNNNDNYQWKKYYNSLNHQ
ncbi:hypothetical protein BCR32DRAFT_264865 [Anaeromyces robustus]|uniref:Uncharacterized protein n=1 Tax=Anaeromyces robustus TaxID=1754192 RepID=A0A1Y1XLL3_9FUNG|nr:hypothetical protein BCR32DRAFT_264865 [Anaeromyces robustus]|eukprot:ORX86593.1 hypothetical protein BCR32DRAFT_264865 [Anaeromyces robustus]